MAKTQQILEIEQTLERVCRERRLACSRLQR